MKNLGVGSIYPTTMSESSLSRAKKTPEEIFKHFWNSFIICSLFFDKLTIPIKGILDDPLFHRLFNEKEKEIDKFTEFISPIMIGNEDQTIKDAGEELIDRKVYLRLNGDNIRSVAEKLGDHDSGFDKKIVNKLKFHKTYFDELLRFLMHFNRNGLLRGKNLLLKGELEEVIKRIEDSQPSIWSKTEYFGSSNAKTALAESMSITPGTKLVLIDIINSLWIYTMQKMEKVNVNLPNYDIELFNVYHKIDAGDAEMHDNPNSLSPQVLQHRDSVLKNKLNIPLPTLPSWDTMSLNDLISLKNSDPMVLYRKLVSEIRKSMPKSSRQIDRRINTIENIYNDYLCSFGDMYCRGRGNRDKFDAIYRELQQKYDFSNIKKVHSWIENAGFASNIISIGEMVLNTISGAVTSAFSFLLLSPAIIDLCFKIKKKRQETTLPLLSEQFVYSHYYNPVLGTVD